MAIVQFKHRAARIDSGLPELGRLYKGAPRQSENQKQIPPDLDHFRFEGADLPTASADDVNAAWDALYGEQPRIIRNVQFAVDRLDLVFDAWQEEWGKSRNGTPLLNKRCDGETIIFFREGDQVFRNPDTCNHQCQCKPTGRLRMFLPELCAELGVLGTVTLITHAGTDIDNISNSLNFVLERAKRLRNVAFVLSREKVQLMTPAGLPVQKWIVRLELDTASAQMVASLAAGEALALPSGMPSQQAEQYPPLPALTYSEDFNKYDENGDDLPEAPARDEMPPDLYDGDSTDDFSPEPGARNFVGRAISAETRKVKNGKAIDLKFASGGLVTIFTREPLRKLSPLWADTVKTWDQPGVHFFVDVAGELDIYSNGKTLEFAIPAKYAGLHAQPED